MCCAVQFRNKLADYIGGLEPEKAIRTHYITRAYFPEDNSYDPMLVEVQRETVQSLYSDFAMLMQNKQRIEAAVRGSKLRQFIGEVCRKKPIACDDYERKMEEDRKFISQNIEKLEQLSRKCILAIRPSDCTTFPEVHILYEQLQNIIWPEHYRYQLMQSYLDEILKR